MEQFGRFRLLKKIGVGGMAEIFLAEAPIPSGGVELCVIKRMLTALQGKPEFVDMFLTEADICTFLRHPNLIDVYEASEIDGRYYMAMEYAQGFELERFMHVLRAQQIECPIGLAVLVGMKLAKALDYLHRATSLAGTPLHLIHRDVNPTNVFLLDSGEVKLGNLGVARIEFLEGHSSPDAPLKGKLRYLAPELIMRKPADQRLDVYDLGVTLWELLSGERAFGQDREEQVMLAIADTGLQRLHRLRPETPKALCHIVEKATSLDPDKRQARAADLYRELRAFVEQQHEHYSEAQVAAMVEYAHELAGDVAAGITNGGALPTQPLPTQPLPTQPLPTQPLPTQPLPTQPLPTQPLPTQPLPTQPLPTQTRAAPEEPDDAPERAVFGAQRRARMMLVLVLGVVTTVLLVAIALAPQSMPSPTATALAPSGLAHSPAPAPPAPASAPTPASSPTPATRPDPAVASSTPAPAPPLGTHANDAPPLRKQSDVVHDIQLAFAELRKGRASQAAGKFETVLRDHPERADARYGLARAYLDLGRNDEALTQAQAALKDRQNDADVWLMVGTAAQELGRTELARHAYERVLFLAPSHKQADDVRAVLKTLR